MNRSIIYIDGLNLYYGALKDTQWKWLDIEKYFCLLRSDDDIQAIKYFTALVTGTSKIDQQTYLSALGTLQKVQIILGKFKDVQIECLVQNCKFPGNRYFQKPEEKRTDVNIGLHMLYDAMSNTCDRFILVSGDSDLVPAIEFVKKIAPEKKISVYIPATNRIRGAATQLRKLADRHLTLPTNLFQHSQLPQIISIPNGTIAKPARWP